MQPMIQYDIHTCKSSVHLLWRISSVFEGSPWYCSIVSDVWMAVFINASRLTDPTNVRMEEVDAAEDLEDFEGQWHKAECWWVDCTVDFETRI